MSKSPSLRRIQADIRELALDPSDRYFAAPLESDMFEWHFTIRGADGTDFEGGVYHGRILLPPEYPFKPPNIVFLTPSGRFETNTKVCLSFSAFHPELWQPAWGIRLILEALISFLPTPADGAIGALDWSKEERRRLAKLSRKFSCPKCCLDGGVCEDLLPQVKPNDNTSAQHGTNPRPSRFAKEIAELRRLQQINDGKRPNLNESKGGTNKLNAAIDKDQTGEGLECTGDEVATETTTQPTEKTSQGDGQITEEMGGTTVSTEENKRSISYEESRHGEIGVNRTNRDGVASPDQTHEIVQEQNVRQTIVESEDVTWIYDPLLNLMMVLLAIICYLLVQKYQDLMEELNELREA